MRAHSLTHLSTRSPILTILVCCRLWWILCVRPLKLPSPPQSLIQFLWPTHKRVIWWKYVCHWYDLFFGWKIEIEHEHFQCTYRRCRSMSHFLYARHFLFRLIRLYILVYSHATFLGTQMHHFVVFVKLKEQNECETTKQQYILVFLALIYSRMLSLHRGVTCAQ